MAAEVALGMEQHSGTPVIIEVAILQRVLETHIQGRDISPSAAGGTER
ncbi:hypothetical protein [Roseovarius sp. MBR-6]|jgi:hypothetical protein